MSAMGGPLSHARAKVQPTQSLPSGRELSSIAILAGRGTVPIELSETALAGGLGVHIVALRGFADRENVKRFPHTWVGLGQVGAMVRALQSTRPDAIVIIGGLDRPNLWHLAPDLGFVRHFGTIAGIMRGGDDAVLRRVIGFFEAQGLRVVGAGEVAPQLIAPLGQLGERALRAQETNAVARATAALAALAPFDAGQACVATPDGVSAIEDGGGTARMLDQLARHGARAEDAVLVKLPKAGQEMRIDLPTIGPDTIAQAEAAGVSAIVVQSGAAIIAERSRTIDAAGVAGIALSGRASTDETRDTMAKPDAPDPMLAVMLATAAEPHVAADVQAVAAIIRRGHPYAIACLRALAEPLLERVESMRGLKWLGFWPRRAGSLAVFIRDARGLDLDATALRLAEACRMARLTTVTFVNGDPDQATALSVEQAFEKSGVMFAWQHGEQLEPVSGTVRT